MNNSVKKQGVVKMIVIIVSLLLVVGLVGGVLSSVRTPSSKSSMKTNTTVVTSSSNSGSSSNSESSSDSGSSGSEVGGDSSEVNSGESEQSGGESDPSSSSDLSGLIPIPEGNGDYVQIDNREGAVALYVVQVDENGSYDNDEDRFVILATVDAGDSYYFDPAREDEYYYQFELATVPDSYEIQYRGNVDGSSFNSFEECSVGDDYVDTLICYPDDGSSSWYFSNHDCGYLRITTTLH